MATRVVAVHQPNFLPWLGYFDKLRRADVFVLLDDVEFQKKRGNWVNRAHILVNGEPWLATVPVVRSYHGVRTIAETEIDESKPWRRMLLRTIANSYGRAPGFEQVMPVVTELIENPSGSLAAHNIASITALRDRLGLEAELVRASELGVPGGKTEKLVGLVSALGGDAYLAGGGAAGYQRDELFAEAGIELIEQRFEHPTYPQRCERMVPRLSVVDAVMSLGFAGAAELIAGRG